MDDTQRHTESLLDIVKGIQKKNILLPEFQRDFRWDLQRTCDLFDSLIREIFIGTVIYGKPSFGMALREIDTRPRKGEGSRRALTILHLSDDEIKRRTSTENLRIVLDGQQRITSLYRALMPGHDDIFMVLWEGLDISEVTKDTPLESILQGVFAEEREGAVAVRLSDAFRAENEGGGEDEFIDGLFANTKHAKELQGQGAAHENAKRLYRRATRKLIDLYKREKMVSFYLLDMQLEKFCLFFERSNSRGVQLDFTDILAAKLYGKFNLRKEIEKIQTEHDLKALPRELIVRAVAYFCRTEGREIGSPERQSINIDRQSILRNLSAEDFKRHWGDTCRAYKESLGYLLRQNYILSPEWIPSETMIIPLMVFMREIQGYERMNEFQRSFLEFWFWASVFSNRYSTSSNEVVITDSNILAAVAKRTAPKIDRAWFARLRPIVATPEDLFDYSKGSGVIYRGVLNLIGYASGGFYDWSSVQKTDMSSKLEDHHIFPRAFIDGNSKLDIPEQDADELVDCVVNRTLIPKITNIRIGKKSPFKYLTELREKNPNLDACLDAHLVPRSLATEDSGSVTFKKFLDTRAKSIFDLIVKYAKLPMTKHADSLGVTIEEVQTPTPKILDNFAAMLSDGRIKVGDRLYVQGHPAQLATVRADGKVEFGGRSLPINTWGQEVTGWKSLNIYEAVVLERAAQPLKMLRNKT